MKRSRSLVLTSMMAGGGLALQACDNAPPATQWADPPAATAPAGAQTDAVVNAAKENNVPVVPFTETLPAGKNYVSWMTDNLDALAAALAQ